MLSINLNEAQMLTGEKANVIKTVTEVPELQLIEYVL